MCLIVHAGRKCHPNDITDLLLNVKSLFMEQPVMLKLKPPITVCGDIHGQFGDLIRIFSKTGFPHKTNYLFLGDYVDRGKMNLEVIIFLFACKLRYPKNFFLLRGNHETQLVNRIYGFYDEIMRRYQSLPLYMLFQSVFNVMPLSAIIGDRILCMHGGLSPDMLKADNLNILQSIYRPLPDPPNPSLPLDLLWADPNSYTDEFKFNDRGISITFGAKMVKRICEKFNLDLICRAHQVVQDGYEFFANRKLVTIFSAPHYCGLFDNAAAVMLVDEQMQCSFKVAQTDQTEPLDLSISKVKVKGDGLQGLSMERKGEEEIGLQVLQTKPLDLTASKVSDERIPIETVMKVMKISKQESRTKKKQRHDVHQKQEHTMTHTDEKPYSCPTCKKNFTESGNMKRHVMSHTGEKPYSCPICGKSSTHPGNMKRHMMTHTGEKPCSCPMCKKNFTNPSYMNKHMMFHANEKPYSCSICKKNFTQFGDMKRHMMIHTGEKPYSCPICRKSFTQFGDMRNI
uniref:Serine/threonine-protein phosphatase n=1 Tax=Brugia malayi TaxID=6279 RepID=A0A0J9YA65_BRUMA|nr:Bm10584 [Brugia malayi]